MTEPKLPPGTRYPTQEELDQLAREPRPYFTGGPYVGGWLQIGYRTLLLTEDEARALFSSVSDPGPKGAAVECSAERSRAPDRQPVAPAEGRAWETPATSTV